MLTTTAKLFSLLTGQITGCAKHAVTLFAVSLAAISINAYAVTPSDQSFNGESPRYLTNAGETITGAIYSMVAPEKGDGAVVALAEAYAFVSITGESDYAVMFNYDGATVVPGAVDARITSADGSEFRIVSMEVDTGTSVGTNPALTVTGYRDGNSVASDSINTGVSDSSGSVTYAKNGISAGFGGVLTFNSDWNYIDEIRFTGNHTIVVVDDLDFASAVLPRPTITYATYNTITGALTVTGSNLAASEGSDILASKFTVTGENGSTYTLTSTPDTEISSNTTFTLMLSDSDRKAVNTLLNNNGTASTGGITYNLAVAENWNTGAIGDRTGNGITVSGAGTNFAPVLNAIGDKYVNEGSLLSFTATASHATMPVEGLTFSLVNPPAGANINPTSGLFNWTPTEAQGPSVYPFTVRVSDGTLSDEEVITVTVNEVNSAPSGVDNTITINEDAAHTFAVANFGFSDSNDSPANNFVSVFISSLPHRGNITLNGIAVSANQSISAADIASGKLVFTPAANANGTGYSSFTFQVRDDGDTSNGGINTSIPNTIIFDVMAVNAAPTATNLSQSKTVTEGGGAVALDDIVVTDVDANDTITATLILSSPSAGTLSTGTFGSATAAFNAGIGVWTVTGSVANVNAALAAVTFTPSANNDQDFTIATRIRDAAGTGPADGTIFVTVTPVNDAPTDISLSSSSVNQSGGVNAVVGTLSSTDADVGNTHTYTLVAGIGSTDNVSFNISGSSLRANNAATLPAGSYSVRVRTTDNNGGTFEKGFTITVTDDVPPAVSSITVSGTPAANATSMDFTVVFDEPVKGQSPDDFVVTATSGNASGVIRVISGSGANYTVRVAEITGSGALRVDLKANTNITDNKGNGNGTNGYVAAFTGGDTHTVDRVAPAVPSAPDMASASDTGESNTDNITKAATPTLTGTADADTTLTVSSSVDGILGTPTEDGVGSWSFIPSVALTDGTHSITVTARDAAGNVSDASAPLEITIDTTPPAKPLPPVLAAPSDTGDSDSDNLTNLTTLTLQGAAGSVEADASVHLDGYLSSATANADGSWTLVVSNLTEGTHQFTIRATDVAGNQSAYSNPLAVTIDTTVPAPGVVTFDQSNVTAANETDISLRLIGAEVGAKASFTITSSNGGTAVTSTDMVVVSPDHRFAGIDTSDLNDGTLTVSLTVTDLAGNVSSAITSTIIKDANVPEVTSIDIDSGNYAEGKKISVTITFSENVTVSGTGSTLALDIGGVTRQAAFRSSTAKSLTYEYIVQATDNTESAGVIVLANGLSLNGGTIRDAAGNDALLTFAQAANAAAQVDTLAPNSAIIISPAAPVWVNADDYTINGMHNENGVTVKLYQDANNDGLPDNGLVLDSSVVSNNSWSLNTALVGDSANNFVVVAIDATGNTSVADVPTITEDSITPSAPVALDLLAVSDTGISDSDNITRDTEPQLSGTAEPHSNITLTSNLDGVTGTAVADSLGGWTITSSVLSNGVHTLTATATDAAGNTSAESAGLIVTIDDQAPSLSAIADQMLNPGASSGDLAISVSDAVSLPANLTLSAQSSDHAVVPAQNLVVGGSGENRTITVTGVSSGTTTITLSVEDEAGNTGTGTLIVSVNAVPTITGAPDTSVDEGEQYNFTPSASDDDGDVLTFSIVNQPSWASFDSATGALTGTPARADVGTTTGIVISVTDGALSASLPAFDLTVVLVNAAPEISGTPATQVDRGTVYRFVPTAADLDGDTLSFSAAGLPAWLGVNSETGEVSGIAPASALGESYAIELTVSDGIESASLSWNLSVVLQIGDITGLWLKDGELANERFGGSLALFDATGDGLAEVYVGSPTRTVTVGNKKLKNAGGVDILAASNGALLHRINAAVAKQRFGSAIAVVADQNNDGVEDLIVGKPFAGAGGEIALHSGDDGSLIRTLVKGEGKAASPIVSIMPLCAIDPQHIVCRILGSSEQGGRIGYSVAVADVDGNGGADLIVGLPQANVKTPVKLNKAGSVIVYQGLTDTPRYVVNGTQAGERFGSSVAADSNYLLVGSPNFDVQAAKKLKDAGRVQLFNLQDGSVAGSVAGNAAKQLFGSAVASFNQDVTGDSEPDWAVAAAGDKSGKPVKLFTGMTQPAQFAEITASAPKKADAIRLAAGLDINGDGVSDLVIGLPSTKVTVPFNNKTKALKNAGQVQVISGANWVP